MSLAAMVLKGAVAARALELGFDRAAIGPSGPPQHAPQFEAWLDAGHAGTMRYLERTRAERTDPGRLLPGARSVVAVALSYKPEEEGREWAGIARYARGRDYHDVMRPRLEALAAYIDRSGPAGTRSRAAVDTSAVLERDLAARAGLGWVGKNTNLLQSDLGSYFFIGIVLTTAALEPDLREADRCGTCTACLDACPTRAFPAPYVLDARRCLSYLTIEHRGEIASDLAPEVRDWIFGCDVCQEVCPWNRKALATGEPALTPSAPPPTLAEILDMDDAAFRARFRGTAITRAKRAGLVRNAALAAGNTGLRQSAPALRRLAGDADAGVRAAAAWALARLARR
jgi:epoxyqueuosine reductase